MTNGTGLSRSTATASTVHAGTKTFVRADCATFRKTTERFGALSNMAGGFPLRVNGIRILTTEALYQAMRWPHIPEVQKRVLDEASPMGAKMKGKPFRSQSRPDWNEVRVELMRWCVRMKLAFHWGAFGGILRATGDRPIVEDSHKDRFWGAVPSKQDPNSLVGDNVLGSLLEEMRELSKGSRLEEVQPLALPDFLLLGQPIQKVTTYY